MMKKRWKKLDLPKEHRYFKKLVQSYNKIMDIVLTSR